MAGSAHIMSRDLVNQSASVACCTLYVSLCAPPAVVHCGQYAVDGTQICSRMVSTLVSYSEVPGTNLGPVTG